MTRHYIYFNWCPTGAHKKLIVFECDAKNLLEADTLAQQAGINYMKAQVSWL